MTPVSTQDHKPPPIYIFWLGQSPSPMLLYQPSDGKLYSDAHWLHAVYEYMLMRPGSLNGMSPCWHHQAAGQCTWQLLAPKVKLYLSIVRFIKILHPISACHSYLKRNFCSPFFVSISATIFSTLNSDEHVYKGITSAILSQITASHQWWSHWSFKFALPSSCQQRFYPSTSFLSMSNCIRFPSWIEIV